MSPTFDIQRATPADAPHIARLNAFVHDIHLEAHPHYFRPTDLDELTASFREWLARDDTAAFIARTEDGTPIGYVTTSFHDRPPTPTHHRRTYLELDQIAVDPAYRHSLIGSALVSRAELEAVNLGASAVHLTTWTFNEGAQHFFEIKGYEPRATQYWSLLPPQHQRSDMVLLQGSSEPDPTGEAE